MEELKELSKLEKKIQKDRINSFSKTEKNDQI